MEEKYPVDLVITRPERSSRFYALLTILFLVPKLIILVPHLVILWFLQIAMFAATILAQFAVLFTAAYPTSFFNFAVGVQRWQVRVNAFLFGLTDRYPPFSL